MRTSDAAIEAAHAIYTPLMLSVYDRLVHGLSNRFAWRCPTQRMLDLYRSNPSSRHLEAGVGTGYGLKRRFDLVEIETKGCVALFRAR